MTSETEALYLYLPNYENSPFTISDVSIDDESDEFVFEVKMKNSEDESLLQDEQFKDTLRSFFVKLLIDLTENIDYGNDLIDSAVGSVA